MKSKKRMTMKAFWKVLKRAVRRIEADTLEGYRGSKRILLIRFRFKNPGERALCYCPVTLVARLLGGPRFAINNHYKAALFCGLNMSSAYRIVDAADDNGSPRIRQKLLCSFNFKISP
jgi:hypothetical protein